MALEPGVRLGSYEIHSAIGAGGMGEVYRARDTKLGRDVAVKIVSDGFGISPVGPMRWRWTTIGVTTYRWTDKGF